MEGQDKDNLPDFENPPIIEVVCGIQFADLRGLTGPQLGLFWSRFKKDYPECQEVPPLTSAIEGFEGEPQIKGMRLTNVPPMPRYWFTQKNETGIIQIQRDRFLHNWKKVSVDAAYPRYESVIEVFRRQLDIFEIFLRDLKVGGIEARQYELTYVNHIPKGEGWKDLGDVGRVFPTVGVPEKGERFLPQEEAFSVRSVFRMPDNQGRLYATLSPGEADGKDVLIFNLTARGMANDDSRDAMWDWFDLAHMWIVRGFVDLTCREQQDKIWKRTQ